MQRPSDHSKWHDSLQDWLDDELNDADRAAFEAHLGRCELCQQQLGEFQELDAALTEAAPPMALDPAFDQQLFARIDAIDESQRAEARRRLEQEWQEQAQALARNWRRTLALVIPGIIGGIVLAFALMSWLDSSGITNNLVAQGAAELGGSSIDYLRLGITAVVGAAFGMLVAPWLARLAE
ncbi:zf-HC2 domain-containing protein [Steroidobacter sp. S1-65]|uniref:Zf-HC2 domain-containing protein n=1 Tax=Steroidobacter gossypii TaxID=2805490 RepID=A0ABS1WUB9_9GAMM|nr:zf-HC2 domain-containing protein [Steroidobacter gossypii]MBM0104552.1 zf-HC2 domain-containing protein [Steroidobacter gossypii]